MSTEASWFHVFDSTRSLWLQEEDFEFGSHGGAAEFQSYEEAEEVAQECIKHNPDRFDGSLVVLADHGLVESKS